MQEAGEQVGRLATHIEEARVVALPHRAARLEGDLHFERVVHLGPHRQQQAHDLHRRIQVSDDEVAPELSLGGEVDVVRGMVCVSRNLSKLHNAQNLIGTYLRKAGQV